MMYESYDMTCKILVVEDEIFVATEIEYLVAELGHSPIGIAADKNAAFNLAPFADIALVDLNLRDGPTGTEIGRTLAEQHGVTVLFMTAKPVPARRRRTWNDRRHFQARGGRRASRSGELCRRQAPFAGSRGAGSPESVSVIAKRHVVSGLRG
jgi:CheY-like chemotaxis protein